MSTWSNTDAAATATKQRQTRNNNYYLLILYIRPPGQETITIVLFNFYRANGTG